VLNQFASAARLREKDLALRVRMHAHVRMQVSINQQRLFNYVNFSGDDDY
jgi:hypothetical protein